MIAGKPVLELKNLTVGYGSGPKTKQVLAKINLVAKTKQLIALMGANGTGKSTLLRSLCRLQPILAGEFWLSGKPTNSLSTRELATQLSVVLTDRVQTGYLTVKDLVAMGRHPYTDWRGQLQRSDLLATEVALQVAGLSELQEEYLHRLSDGQLQKAMIARALAQDGNLMLLDEPLIHLDIPSKWEIMGLLKRMAQDNEKTIILATHELDLSLQLADRIWLINRNRKLLEGTPEELVQNGSISEAFDTEHFQFQKSTLYNPDGS